ncbi:hypothetical protein Tco_0697288, partial [Tanacetum coccineum]
PYDCKVTIRSRPSTILFIKERLSKTNKRLELFKDTVFGKYLDLDVEDNNNHLLNYVLHHQRPELSKSIDSNLVFDIAGHTLLFERSEFCLVTGFACEKVVFPEYMDDGIPPFLRCKAAKGKAAIGKAAKGKAAKRKATQGKAAQPSNKGDTHSVTILDLRSLIWDDEKWKKLSVEDSIRGEYYWEEFYKKAVNLIDNLKDTHINFKKKNPSKLPTYSIYGFTWAFKARAKVEETKSTREVALEEELDLWKSRYVEPESYYKNLEASVEIARTNSPGLSFPTPNAKATSVCDDIDEANAAANDNAKDTNVHDDVGVPDAVVDDNVKATSVCDDIDEADAAADDNAKAMSVHDDVGVPDATADDNVKATSVCDDINEADAVTDDNAKTTSVHDDVGVPYAAVDDNAKATSVCDDIDEANAAVDDNANATSVHDDVGVPDAAADDNAKVSDAAADDNAKATSVCDDIDEADAAVDDNAKATSVYDDVGVPDAVADDNAKATSVCDDIDQADVTANDNTKERIKKTKKKQKRSKTNKKRKRQEQE